MAEPANMVGNDVINYALTLHGILYIGQVPGTDALLMCQTALNNMLAEWNAQGLAVFSIVKTTATLVSGTADYTIGNGATINTARPEKIEAWRVIDAAGGANGGKPVDAGTFAREADDNTLLSALVKMLNYDAAFPTGTIHLWPIPSGGTLELWVWEQMTAITDFIGTAISFPPGYLKAITYNLAIDLAPLFGRQIDPGVKMIADQCKATLGGTNISELTRQDPKTVQQKAR